jgi:hypothetical protein
MIRVSLTNEWKRRSGRICLNQWTGRARLHDLSYVPLVWRDLLCRVYDVRQVDISSQIVQRIILPKRQLVPVADKLIKTGHHSCCKDGPASSYKLHWLMDQHLTTCAYLQIASCNNIIFCGWQKTYICLNQWMEGQRVHDLDFHCTIW